MEITLNDVYKKVVELEEKLSKDHNRNTNYTIKKFLSKGGVSNADQNRN